MKTKLSPDEWAFARSQWALTVEQILIVSRGDLIAARAKLEGRPETPAGAPPGLEQPTRLRVLRGASPRAVNWPIRTASMSDARAGNGPELCSDVDATAALRSLSAAVGVTWVASKPGGLNVRNDDALRKGVPA